MLRLPASGWFRGFVDDHGSGPWLPRKGEPPCVSGLLEGLRSVLGGRNPAEKGGTTGSGLLALPGSGDGRPLGALDHDPSGPTADRRNSRLFTIH
jgi:hypothetical protein